MKNIFGQGIWRAIGIVAVLLLTSAFVFGQAEAGALAGVVKDSTGAVVEGANVTAKNTATNAERKSVTGSLGQYTLESLTPGTYEVTVSKSGFKTFKTTGEVAVGGNTTIDAQLAVGSSDTVVEVIGGAATEVNTQTQELSQLIDSQQISQLPSLTRNPYDFVAISGNVSNGDTTSNGATMSNGGGGQELSNRGVGFSINGQRESGTEILLDGVENVSVFSVGIGNNVPIDGVQEYSIVTNNFSAEYGRASGGVVNVTTKVGSNAWHGSGWEFNRLSAYTANTFNNVANGLPKGDYTRNQFGFQVGGPIIKNKLFVSETTEWTRVRSSSVQTEEIFDPSFIALLPANAQAYFAQYGTGALPSAGVAATVGQINACTTCPNSFTMGLVNGTTALSPSQPVFDTVNFNVPFNDGGGPPTNSYELVGRLDYNISDKTQLFFRAARDIETLFAGTTSFSTYPQYNTGSAFQNQSWLLSGTHTFNSYLVDNAKVSFARFDSITSFDTALTNSPNLMFFPGLDPVTGTTIQLPGLQNANAPGAGGLPFGGPQNNIQFEDDLSWTKGKHNMRFGGQYTYIQLNVAYGAYAQAVEQLGGTAQDSMNDLINSAGNPGGSVLSGTAGFSARVNPNGALPCPLDPLGNTPPVCPANSEVTPPLTSASYGRSYRYNDWAIYGQDSFRLTPRLTLNYGLRWEHFGVQHNNNQSLDSNFYFGQGSNVFEQTRNGQVFNAQQEGGFWQPQWGTFGPRVGFAYDVFGDGKTSLRGGFGISYERNFGNVTFNSSFNPPASAVLASACAAETGYTPATYPGCTTALVTNNDLGPLGLSSTPPTTLPPVELRFVDNKIRVAQTQFWSLDLQRELAHNTILELGYSGAHGVHLYDLNNVNSEGMGQEYLGDPLVGTGTVPGETCNPNFSSNGACLTPSNSQYAAINERGSGGTSSYNAMNIKLQTQNLHKTGLTLVANYTWSKSLDDTSSTFSDSIQGGSGVGYGSLGYTLAANPKLDWGPSDYDVRNRFVVSPIWQTPWYKGERGVGEALGGWSLVGVFTARTGVPFTVYDASNDFNFYTFPRLAPATAITNYHVSGNPQAIGANTYSLLTVPLPANLINGNTAETPYNTALGISDFGPFPANMTGRNAFRGPGAWNLDAAVNKDFKLTERYGLTFRAEGFNIFNHHNMYTDTQVLAYFTPNPGSTYTPLTVTGLKGGLNTIAEGGNNDERRFGQFSLRFTF